MSPSSSGPSDRPQDQHVRGRAGWLPDQEALERWLREHRARAGGQPLHPAVQHLADLAAGDAVVRMLLERMVAEEPRGKQYVERHVHSLQELYQLLSAVLTTAPTYSQDSMVMTPVAALLDWPMATPSGEAAFRDPRVNDAFGRILRAWCEHLDSPASRDVLVDADGGWLSPAAKEAVGLDQYVHDPGAEHAGFTSWNDFFTRRFREGQRPVADPGDDAVVVSPCESVPYGVTTNAQLTDSFWVKTQPYSLRDLLAGDPLAERFAGGTVFQAFLSATDYHRWHAPVGGRVVRAANVPGTYYSVDDAEGSSAYEPAASQAYLAHVAARAVVVLEADDPRLGLVGFVAVGMVDVSSCVIADHVTEGAHLAKGDELGHFAFGGSTYCLLLQPGVELDLALHALPQPHLPDAPLVRVRSRLARVVG
ncbi:phosphatidylserine decarboxylase family protein [Streptomyces sp. NP160]|uniref:phosphatidylserine decarboxylase family protein n=1 Tax=Streptomyces sp. NP160 TaxID=2586637 RepID=UPI00111AE8AE|nr:phosphatidylserine decarboxylase family protein [Streptomyces sp. NP160]TNM68780.1 phosphatidylserine decarboxylase family protein [Streptomyces sp. NP160]